MPDIGDHLWLVEAYIASAWYGRYFEIGALTSTDVYGGFSDIDDNGLDEMLIVVDHEVSCDGDTCDLFVFAFDAEFPSVDNPCNWLLIDDIRTNIKRSRNERYVTFDEQPVVLESLPMKFEGHIEGQGWLTYFEDVYGTTVEWDEILLSHVRVGTYDVNSDGQKEVFIYVVSPPICGRDECGGAILELLPSDDGSKPTWRWIGELNALDPAMNIDLEDEAHVWPGRTMRVIDETVDGYTSLCSRGSYLRWNGETYDIRLSMSDYEAERLGCPN